LKRIDELNTLKIEQCTLTLDLAHARQTEEDGVKFLAELKYDQASNAAALKVSRIRTSEQEWAYTIKSLRQQENLRLDLMREISYSPVSVALNADMFATLDISGKGAFFLNPNYPFSKYSQLYQISLGLAKFDTLSAFSQFAGPGAAFDILLSLERSAVSDNNKGMDADYYINPNTGVKVLKTLLPINWTTRTAFNTWGEEENEFLPSFSYFDNLRAFLGLPNRYTGWGLFKVLANGNNRFSWEGSGHYLEMQNIHKYFEYAASINTNTDRAYVEKIEVKDTVTRYSRGTGDEVDNYRVDPNGEYYNARNHGYVLERINDQGMLRIKAREVFGAPTYVTKEFFAEEKNVQVDEHIFDRPVMKRILSEKQLRDELTRINGVKADGTKIVGVERDWFTGAISTFVTDVSRMQGYTEITQENGTKLLVVGAKPALGFIGGENKAKPPFLNRAVTVGKHMIADEVSEFGFNTASVFAVDPTIGSSFRDKDIAGRSVNVDPAVAAEMAKSNGNIFEPSRAFSAVMDSRFAVGNAGVVVYFGNNWPETAPKVPADAVLYKDLTDAEKAALAAMVVKNDANAPKVNFAANAVMLRPAEGKSWGMFLPSIEQVDRDIAAAREAIVKIEGAGFTTSGRIVTDDHGFISVEARKGAIRRGDSGLIAYNGIGYGEGVMLNDDSEQLVAGLMTVDARIEVLEAEILVLKHDGMAVIDRRTSPAAETVYSHDPKESKLPGIHFSGELNQPMIDGAYEWRHLKSDKGYPYKGTNGTAFRAESKDEIDGMKALKTLFILDYANARVVTNANLSPVADINESLEAFVTNADHAVLVGDEKNGTTPSQWVSMAKMNGAEGRQADFSGVKEILKLNAKGETVGRIAQMYDGKFVLVTGKELMFMLDQPKMGQMGAQFVLPTSLENKDVRNGLIDRHVKELAGLDLKDAKGQANAWLNFTPTTKVDGVAIYSTIDQDLIKDPTLTARKYLVDLKRNDFLNVTNMVETEHAFNKPAGKLFYKNLKPYMNVAAQKEMSAAEWMLVDPAVDLKGKDFELVKYTVQFKNVLNGVVVTNERDVPSYVGERAAQKTESGRVENFKYNGFGPLVASHVWSTTSNNTNKMISSSETRSATLAVRKTIADAVNGLTVTSDLPNFIAGLNAAVKAARASDNNDITNIDLESYVAQVRQKFAGNDHAANIVIAALQGESDPRLNRFVSEVTGKILNTVHQETKDGYDNVVESREGDEFTFKKYDGITVHLGVASTSETWVDGLLTDRSWLLNIYGQRITDLTDIALANLIFKDGTMIYGGIEYHRDTLTGLITEVPYIALLDLKGRELAREKGGERTYSFYVENLKNIDGFIDIAQKAIKTRLTGNMEEMISFSNNTGLLTKTPDGKGYIVYSRIRGTEGFHFTTGDLLSGWKNIQQELNLTHGRMHFHYLLQSDRQLLDNRGREFVTMTEFNKSLDVTHLPDGRPTWMTVSSYNDKLNSRLATESHEFRLDAKMFKSEKADDVNPAVLAMAINGGKGLPETVTLKDRRIEGGAVVFKAVSKKEQGLTQQGFDINTGKAMFKDFEGRGGNTPDHVRLMFDQHELSSYSLEKNADGKAVDLYSAVVNHAVNLDNKTYVLSKIYVNPRQDGTNSWVIE
ncbi:MAG: hypothetical protein HQL22_12155, partial [Candidatus Omnitrophica bacterium]|nr:hypothetical protein [Candidatus Omnitrophota bacterium]